MERVLVNTDEYNGRYVAMKSFDDPTVLGVGDDPETAMKDAVSKGFSDPVFLYIPKTEIVYTEIANGKDESLNTDRKYQEPAH